MAYSPLSSKVSVEPIYVLKTSYNNQCPHDWFITQAMTAQFKTLVSASVIAYISALRTICLQSNYLLLVITF
jgi:hypothetical protein